MNRRLRSIFIISLGLLPGVFGDKKPRGPEVDVVQMNAHRSEDLILVDGKFKNISEKPLRRLRYMLDFLGTDGKQVLTTRNSEIEEEVFDPGAETEVHSQIQSPAGATSFLLRFDEAGGRPLRALKTGPYPIE
jgi:hypothetical protein